VVIGLVAVPVSVRVAPLHTDNGDAVAVTNVGVLFTVTEAVVAVALPHILVAVSVYTPADKVVVMIPVGLSTAEEYVLGPVHE
jgi:hypothetical protein